MSYDEMKISKLGDACCGCGACAAKCPKSCISMQEDKFGFLHPVIDAGACVGCHACESVCPALGGGKCDEALGICWAKGKSSELLEASSSGGIFGLLAESVIAGGGVVCGAAWADGCRHVEHVLVEDAVSLDRIMRSKYVQSRVGREVYAGVRDAIRSGRRVLFAGTACQVAGLKRYLGKTGGAPFSSPLTLSATASRRRAYGRSGLTTRMCSAIRTSVTLICGVRQPDGCLSPLCTST